MQSKFTISVWYLPPPTSHTPRVSSQATSCSTLKHWPQLTSSLPRHSYSHLTKHNLTGEIEGGWGQEDWEGENREVQQTKDGCQGCQGQIQREGKREGWMSLEREIHPSSTNFPRVLQGLMPKRNPNLTMRRTVLGPARKWSRIQWTVSRNHSQFFINIFSL